MVGIVGHRNLNASFGSSFMLLKKLYAGQLQQFMDNSAQSFVDEIFNQIAATKKSRKRKVGTVQ